MEGQDQERGGKDGLGSTPLEGRCLGRYRVVERIGEGGMGAIYRGVRTDGVHDEPVAIKLIKRGLSSPETIRRFQEERRILGRLRHPNIAGLLDAGSTDEGWPFLVMELIEGQPLLDWCKDRDLSVEERLDLFQSICSAVHYAHRHLVIHRDLKPANILVDRRGAPQLLDFGIAKLLREEDEAETQTGAIGPLSPAYASPEQLRGEAISTASDVYSLGVLLYEMLTGHSPHGAPHSSLQQVREAVLRKDPERPSCAVRSAAGRGASESGLATGDPVRWSRMLAGDLDTIVLMTLRKDPLRRYRSARELAEDIRRYLQGRPVAARRDTLAYRTRKFVGRHKVAVAATLGVGLLAVAVAIHMATQQRRLEQERTATEKVSQLLVDVFGAAETGPEGGEITMREALDRGALEVLSGLEGQPRVRAKLMDTLGTAYMNLGLYTSASPLLEAALKTRQQSSGKVHLESADSLAKLAELRIAEGRYDEAETLSREVLALRRRLLDKHHPDVAAALHALGLVRKHLGDFDEAERLYRQALDLRRRSSGERDPELATNLNDLGVLLDIQGSYAEAERLYGEVLGVLRGRYGDRHPHVALALNNLAMARNRRGDYRTAAGLHRESLEIQRRLFGEAHPDIATNLNNLAAVLMQLGDNAEAETLFAEALAMRRTLLGDEHPVVAQNLANLAVAVRRNGRHDDAERLLREALGLQRKLAGEGHPDVAQVMDNLGSLLWVKDEREEAETLFRRALEIRRQALGEDHPAVASSLRNLGVMRWQQLDLEEAEELLREALVRQRRTLQESPEVALTSQRLAGVLHLRGALGEAETLLRDALRVRRLRLPEDHPDIGESLIGLGAVLVEQGRGEAGEPLLREGLALLQGVLPPGHPRIADAQGELGACLVALRRYDDAETLLLASYSALRARLGDAHQRLRRARLHLVELFTTTGRPERAALYHEPE